MFYLIPRVGSHHKSLPWQIVVVGFLEIDFLGCLSIESGEQIEGWLLLEKKEKTERPHSSRERLLLG